MTPTPPPASRGPLDLDAIRQRAEAASPAPWKWCGCRHCGLIWCKEADCVVAAALCHEDESFTCGEGSLPAQRNKDADFIAHAREDVPWLVERLAALTRRLEAAEAALQSLVWAANEAASLMDAQEKPVSAGGEEWDSILEVLRHEVKQARALAGAQ